MVKLARACPSSDLYCLENYFDFLQPLFVKKNRRKTIYHNLIIIYPLDDIPVGMIGVERQGLFFYEVFIEPMRQGRGEILSMEGV